MRSLELISVLLLAISSNADNFVVGIAYGIGNIRVPLASNLFIAVLTGVATFASMLLGQRIGYFMPPQLANLVGGGIIAGLGVWAIVQSVQSPAPSDQTASPPATLGKLLFVLQNPLSVDRDFSGYIDLKEACLLAVALSVNNVGNGIGAGMVGMSPVLTTLAVMLLSIAMLWSGVAAGQYGQRLLGSLARVISGVLLVAVGMYEIHL